MPLQIKSKVLNSIPVKEANGGALGLLDDVYTNRTATLTFASQPNAGDTITVANTTYTYVSTNTGAANTILIAGTKEDTALNTLMILNTVENADINRFSWTIGTLNTIIKATELTVSPEALSTAVISSSSHGAGRLTQVYGGSAYTIVNTESYAANGYGLLGKLGKLTFASQTPAGAGNATLFRMYVDAIGYRTAPAAITTSANDLISKFTFKVGTELYNSYMYNPLGNTAQAGIDDAMYCIKASDDTSTPGSGVASTYAGKVFTMNLQANQATVTAAAISTFQGLWNTDAAKISFKQNNYMTIQNNGDITVENIACGTTDGMSALIKTADFDGLTVNSVKSDSTGITVIMEQGGANKTFTTGAFANQYLKGTQITLTESATGDTLIINVGKKNLDVDTAAKQIAFAKSLQKALSVFDIYDLNSIIELASFETLVPVKDKNHKKVKFKTEKISAQCIKNICEYLHYDENIAFLSTMKFYQSFTTINALSDMFKLHSGVDTRINFADKRLKNLVKISTKDLREKISELISELISDFYHYLSDNNLSSIDYENNLKSLAVSADNFACIFDSKMGFINQNSHPSLIGDQAELVA